DGIGVFGHADLDGNFGAGVGIDFGRVGASVLMEADNTASGIDASRVLVGASFSSGLKPSVLAAGGRTAVFELDAGLRRYGPPTGGLFSRRLAGWDVELGLARAVDDERIDSVLIKVQDPELSWSFVEDLRRQIERLRNAGKRVFVYLRDADNLGYYLGCSADRLLLNPGGGFFVTGPVVEALFLGGAMQMIGARAEYRRVGKYKSFVETLTREQPSEPSREVLESMADELAGVFEQAVAKGRSMDRQKVHELLDRGLMTPQEAKEAGLVDELVREDELEKFLEKQLGHSVSFERRYLARHVRNERWGRRPTIAVVHASGSIGYRAGLLGGMDAHRLADVLDWLYRTDRVDGVVLRVDSPGGSVAASDMIWHMLERLKERKPVVVSMGDVAASGGYYISAPADRIFAEPSTITGSIGVFALFMDLSDLYASLGISKEIIKRHKLADLVTTFRGRTDEELELVQRNVNAFYRRFIEIVAKGRNTTPDNIDRIGRGRVWTGKQALERGLVDEMGGLRDAVEEVKKRLGLSNGEAVDLLHLPRPRLSIAGFLKDIGVLSSTTDDLLEFLDRQQLVLLQLAAFGRMVPAAVVPALIHIR
ncbi:MAG: signal peptide peptidase SppA, partial [Deltaproteobacteria bacterium]